MKPTASSLTDCIKPGLARVTSTPALEAASTSILRMSTAQRTIARSFGRFAEDLGRRRGQAIGNDHVGIARRSNQSCRVQRLVGAMQQHVAHLAQPAQRPLPVILSARLRSVGREEFFTGTVQISRAVLPSGSETRH